ncbi:MAG: ClpXP protease specificity-enhancing factor SspB [Rickettsiales bacterium]|nr:ClpXP protease specificity-enhancing factor SspB [Rickettsiales bacterium]
MDDQMNFDYIDYPSLIDQAMRSVVRTAIEQVMQTGLPGDHHFFVSFQTDYPGVSVSDALKDRYPDEMTIVIQHQFWDLNVTDEWFTVTLSFNGTPETLVIPFDALTAFADPSIKFGLQFHRGEWEEEESEDVHCPATGRTGREMPPEASFDEEAPSEAHPAANDSKVVSIEAFRKK